MKFKMMFLGILLLTLGSLARAEEGPAPWLLQPLQPPSRLAIKNLTLLLDYRARERPGSVRLKCQADLHNEGLAACQEQFLVISADAGSKVTWNGKDLNQERLVMPVPDSRQKTMTRVSIFHLILLPREEGRLEFTALQKLDYRTPVEHQVHLLFPLRRAWREVGPSTVRVVLAPELKLANPEFKPVAGQALTFERHFSLYSKGLDLNVEAKTVRPAWAGALGTVPALRRAWLWGGLAALLAVTLVGLAGRGWWLAIPLSLLLNLGFRQFDDTVNQWTYYQDASEYKRALELEWFLVTLWAFLGGLGVAVLGQTKEKK